MVSVKFQFWLIRFPNPPAGALGTLVGKLTPTAPNDSQWLPMAPNDSRQLSTTTNTRFCWLPTTPTDFHLLPPRELTPQPYSQDAMAADHVRRHDEVLNYEPNAQIH